MTATAAPDLETRQRVTALVATHDPALLDLADRVLALRDGAFVDEPAAAATAATGRG